MCVCSFVSVCGYLSLKKDMQTARPYSLVTICVLCRKDSRLFLTPNEAVELLRLELFAMRFGKDSPYPSLQVRGSNT